jgi:hypothetical protein
MTQRGPGLARTLEPPSLDAPAPLPQGVDGTLHAAVS